MFRFTILKLSKNMKRSKFPHNFLSLDTSYWFQLPGGLDHLCNWVWLAGQRVWLSGKVGYKILRCMIPLKVSLFRWRTSLAKMPKRSLGRHPKVGCPVHPSVWCPSWLLVKIPSFRACLEYFRPNKNQTQATWGSVTPTIPTSTGFWDPALDSAQTP